MEPGMDWMNQAQDYAEWQGDFWQDTVQVYTGNFWHPTFQTTMEIAVTLYNGTEGTWSTLGEMESATAAWNGDRFLISNGSIILNGAIDEQGVIAGPVVYDGIQS